MIIECEFTNASDFVRERVVFVTGMQLMVDSANRLFSVWWDDPLILASLFKLKIAMHDPEFGIYLERDGWLITMARCLGVRWTFFFISINWRQGERIHLKIRQVQRAFRRRFMRRRLGVDMVFSKALSAQRVLLTRGLNDDVVWVILSYYFTPANRPYHGDLQKPPDRPLRWVKPQCHCQIFA
jgi:hypothetical protein